MTDGIKTFEGLTLDTGRLVLTPEDCNACCPTELLIRTLEQIEFIGASRNMPITPAIAGWTTGNVNAHANRDANGHATETETGPGAILTFDPGERFSEHLAFTGCAVQIGGESDIHVWLPAISAEPMLLVGRNSRPPRCPGCGSTLQDWRAQLPSALWPATASGACKHLMLVCPNCETHAPASDWDWRKQAGIGRQWLIIEGVFPKEASPLPSLLANLEGLDLGPWHYAYLQR